MKDYNYHRQWDATAEACQSSVECQSQLCVQEPDGQTICRIKCYSASDCPAGESCAPFPGVGYGACVEAPSGGSTPGTKQMGESCQTSDARPREGSHPGLRARERAVDWCRSAQIGRMK